MRIEFAKNLTFRKIICDKNFGTFSRKVFKKSKRSNSHACRFPYIPGVYITFQGFRSNESPYEIIHAYNALYL